MSIWHLARRELLHHLQSPLTYVVSAAFLFLAGFFYSSILDGFARASAQSMGYGEESLSAFQLVAAFYESMGLIAVLFLPALTMRVLAEEQRDGSLPLLLSSPISSLEIVVGKWLGVCGFLVLLMGVGLAYVPLATMAMGSLPLLPTLVLVFGLLVLAATCAAIGVAASALSGSQVLAAVLTWVALLGLWILGILETAGGALGWLGQHVAMLPHFSPMTQGLVRSNDLVYFGLITALALLVAQQRVESHRWR
jgi:ABC-2 type transport system permease protein